MTAKTLLEYIEQIELEGDVHPGDGFEIEIGEDTVIETTVLESWEDSILIALDNEVVKVNFGDKKLSIKKHIPGRRKNFRARHNCDNPGPRWKARYWSCRAW